MKTHLLSLASFCLSAAAAMAVPVTFQVDLAPQINLGTFDPEADRVDVRGSFDNWGTGFTLTRANAESTIYTGTHEIPGTAGSEVQWKFVKVINGTDNWESSPNRPFSLSSTAQTLPVGYFDNVWEGGTIPVTFSVNMATQQAAGTFNPAAGDVVEVRGAFNNWTSGFVLEPSTTNPAIYTGTAEVSQAPGARVEYKFVMSHSDGSGVVWENDPNRAFTQTAEPQTLPIVYFNNVTGVPVKAILQFAVDLTAQIGAGRFDPAVDQVYIRGNKVGWGNPPEGIQLLPDASRSGVYTNAYKSDSLLTGDRIEYKATIWNPETSTTTWEDGNNRSYTFEGTEPKDANGYLTTVAGPWYFNNVEPNDLITEEAVITFKVNMANARTTGGAPFNPETDTVFVNGSFFPTGWQTWGALELQAFDDGQSGGDTTANDGIYTAQYTLPRGSAARVEYKYGINGADNEAASNNNHVRFVRETGTYALPLDLFGTMTQENETLDIGSVAIAKGTNGKVVLTWQGQAGARLQKTPSLANPSWTDVAGTEGLSTYEYTMVEDAAFFRVAKP